MTNNKLRQISLCMLLVLSGFSHATTLDVPSNIQAVTVYPDSARITRHATVKLAAGESRLLLNGLPLQLQTESLRISGHSSSPVTLGSVNLSQHIQTELVQEKERLLRAEIEKWQEKRREVVDMKSRAEQQLLIIQATVLQKPTGSASPQTIILPLEQWQPAWDTLDQATAQAQARIRATDKTLKAFDDGLQQLHQQLAAIATGETRSRSAILYVNAPEATELQLTLRYQIKGTSWKPVYNAELDTDNNQLTLQTQAEIQQLTGEDWNNVTVQLSTLHPSNSAGLPALESWIVRLHDKLSFSSEEFYEADMAKDEAVETLKQANLSARSAAKRQAPAPAASLQLQNSQLLNTTFNAEYQVPGKLTLSSGSDSRRVTLSSQTLKTELGLYSYPRIDPRVVLVSQATYTADAPLLAGSVALYRDGSFIGNTSIETLQSGETLKLSFGEDNRIHIDFQPVPEKSSSYGLISTRNHLERAYRISINNQHDNSREITIYDSIPVASNEDISVSLTGDKPDLENVEHKEGVVAWVRQIPAGENTPIEYGYHLSYPEDKVLSGL